MYSQISTADGDRIKIRGRDLVDEVIGTLSFTDMIVFTVLGRVPNDAERRMTDAILVSLVDHGVTPSTLVARLTFNAAPEAFQGAVAAGLLNSGSRVLGSMENTAKLLSDALSESEDTASLVEIAQGIVEQQRANRVAIPGIGHRTHRAGDPRADKLFALADDLGFSGRYVQLLRDVSTEASRKIGKDLPINVTGAIGAILLELGVPWRAARGFGLMSRIVGIVAHISEEHETRTVRDLLRRLQDSTDGSVTDGSVTDRSR